MPFVETNLNRITQEKKDHSPIGILITNVGTPDAPTPKALRPYLAEFLSDKRVIDYPRWFWLPLLHGIILNTRPKRSARLYQKIWTAKGSPLLMIMEQQAKGIARLLEESSEKKFVIKVGLRYGNPSIAAGLRALRDEGVSRIIVFPLFPQYSATTTASSLDAVFDELKTWRWVPELQTVNNYFDSPGYIQALAKSVRDYWVENGNPDRLLFSFHGIPKRYAESGDPYPEECRQTAQLIAETLELEPNEWAVAFQSRFGPEEWLKPYTDETLEHWGAEGVNRVHVLAPGFSADCLETIDELGREGKETFIHAGGREFAYIPALNKQAAHIQALAEVLRDHLEGWL